MLGPAVRANGPSRAVRPLFDATHSGTRESLGVLDAALGLYRACDETILGELLNRLFGNASIATTPASSIHSGIFGHVRVRLEPSVLAWTARRAIARAV